MNHHHHIAKAWNASNRLLTAQMRDQKRAQEYWYKRTFHHLEAAIETLSKPQPEPKKKKR